MPEETRIGSDPYFDWHATNEHLDQDPDDTGSTQRGLSCVFCREVAEEIEKAEARRATEVRHPLIWGIRTWAKGYESCTVDPLVGWTVEELVEEAPFSEAAATSVGLDLSRAIRFLFEHPSRPPHPFPDPRYVIVTTDGAAHLETPFFHHLRSRIVIT